MPQFRFYLAAIVCGLLLAFAQVAAAQSPGNSPPGNPPPADAQQLFARDNLVAWCIVPFDAKKRSPADRAAMLEKLGFQRFAYDWRGENLPTLETELDELKRRHIELTAVWFPALG